jgi:hypothetical protein
MVPEEASTKTPTQLGLVMAFSRGCFAWCAAYACTAAIHAPCRSFVFQTERVHESRAPKDQEARSLGGRST